MRKFSLFVVVVISLFASLSSSASNYTKTKYPIVLVHGLSGFDNIGGVINYFYVIPRSLERSGAKVYIPSVSAFNSSEVRGQQLANYLGGLPEAKFNLIGHSQGGPTARVAAALVPSKVASVTTVGGVNGGSKVADITLGVLPPGIGQDIAISIFEAFGSLINLFSGANNPQDSLASAVSLSTAGTQQLNAALDFKGISPNCSSLPEDINIAGNNIKAFSWGGDRRVTNFFDISDSILAVSGLAFGFEPNDGQVSVCSTKFGRVVGGPYSLNHFDLVNQLSGLRGFTNPVTLFRIHANRLKNKNL